MRHEYSRRLRIGCCLGTVRACAQPAGGRRSRPVRLRLAAGPERSPSSIVRRRVGGEPGTDVCVLDTELPVVYPGQDHDRCHCPRRPEVWVPSVRAGAGSRRFERQATSGYPHGSVAGWVALLAIVRHPHERRAVCGHAVLATVGFPLADSDRRIRLLVPAGGGPPLPAGCLSWSGRAVRPGFFGCPRRGSPSSLPPPASPPPAA